MGLGRECCQDPVIHTSWIIISNFLHPTQCSVLADSWQRTASEGTTITPLTKQRGLCMPPRHPQRKELVLEQGWHLPAWVLFIQEYTFVPTNSSLFLYLNRRLWEFWNSILFTSLQFILWLLSRFYMLVPYHLNIFAWNIPEHFFTTNHELRFPFICVTCTSVIINGHIPSYGEQAFSKHLLCARPFTALEIQNNKPTA